MRRLALGLGLGACLLGATVAHAQEPYGKWRGARWLNKLAARYSAANASNNPSINVGPQGRRNATNDESRAVQGPPNSFGFMPNTGN
jgi:hypothetical protein